MSRRSGAVLAAWAFIAVGVVAAMAAGLMRYRAERQNRSVAITVDYDEMVRLASSQGRSVPSVLKELGEAGVTSVAITEDTLEELRDRGLASVSGTQRLATVRLADPGLVEQVREAWEARGLAVVPEPEPSEGPYTLLWCPQTPGRSYVFRGSIAALLPLGTGLSSSAVENVRRAGLECVARLSNFPGASEATLRRVLRREAAQGARVVICTGTEVLGYYGQQKAMARALADAGMWFGLIEFGKQKGDAALGAVLRGRYIRVHSISEGEMGTLSEDEAVDRFVRAARERNIRLCYVRLLTLTGDDAIAANKRYLASIVAGIGREGLLRPGSAKPFRDAGVPLGIYVLVGAAMGALAGLLVIRTVPGAEQRDTVWVVALAVVCAGLAASGDTGRRLVALLGAVTAPTLGMLELVQLIANGGEQALATRWQPLVVLVRASLWTVLGILGVVGLLASLPYMVQTKQFTGIKAAHALPMLLVATLLVAGLPDAMRSASESWSVMRQRVRAFLSQPMLVGALVLTLVILGAMMLALVRTGNEPGVGVSDLELKFRSLLDALLPARPRTKEFLIGHPAMVLAAFLGLRGRRNWAAPLAVLAALGQASLLNTFCHIHTPLVISVVRAVTGVVLGGALGLLVAACIAAVEGRSGRAASPG